MEFHTIPQLFNDICNKFTDTKAAYKYKKSSGSEFVDLKYSELRDDVESLSLALMELGIHQHDNIGIVSENRIEWILSDLAITTIGAVDVPIFPTNTAKQEEFIFNDSKVAAVFVSNNFQLNKLLEVKDNIPSLRHIIVFNEIEDANRDLAIKSFSDLIERGKELKSQKEGKNLLKKAYAKVKPDDLLTIIYTSGTTGNPKGVMLTHKNVLSNVSDAIIALEPTGDDIFLSFLPLCHSYERTTGYLTAFASGSTCAIAESVETVASNIQEIRPTIMTTVPKLLETIRKKIYLAMERESPAKFKVFNWAIQTGKKRAIALDKGKMSFTLKQKIKLAEKLVFSKIKEKTGGRLRFFVSGGAALPEEVGRFFEAVGIEVMEGYGLTEAAPVLAVNKSGNIEVGTVGPPLSQVEIKIAEDGEILARGPNIMKGYWNDPVATEGAIDPEGWLYTGDIGQFTEKGNLKITDRKKNIFVNSGGKNIAPQPIENLLSQSKYIDQVVLIGDKREYVTALITPNLEQLAQLAKTFNIDFNKEEDLITNDKIISRIKQDIDYQQKDLAKFEKVRRFSMLSKPFSIENGELSPKMSIKRHVVERKYADFIDKMYGRS